MLDIARAPELRNGLTVFFDHADQNLRYVTSGTPRIAERPNPQLSLLLFRGDEGHPESSGGLLQMETTIAPRKAELDKLRMDLAKTGRVPVLAAPDWRTGTVELTGWLNENLLTPFSFVVQKASLIGDPLAVLAVRLERQGASLAAAALRGGSLPLVVIWKLETLGLGGSLGIEVEADLQAMHQRLTAEGALTTPIGRARLAATWEKFVSEKLIRTRIVDESGDQTENRAEALRRVGENLIADMFSPLPPPEAETMLKDGKVAPIELSFRLTHRKEELEQVRRWSFRERRATIVTHYAAASLTALTNAWPALTFIFTADMGPVTRDVIVRVEPELDTLALAAVEVDLNWPGSRDLDRTLVLTGARAEQRFTIHREPGEPIRYRVRSRYDAAKTRAQNQETGWMEALGNLIVISARKLFPPRALTLAIGRAEMDWIDSVQVEIAPPLEPARTVVLDSKRQSAQVNFPGAGAGPLRFSAKWRGMAGEPWLTADAFESSDDAVILDSPFGDSINIVAVPLPLQDVLTINLELRTVAKAFADRKQLSWDGDDRKALQAGLRRLPADSRAYQYRVTLMHNDGRLTEEPWTDTARPAIVVGSAKPARVVTTEVFVLGGGAAGRGSLAIEFVLTSGADSSTTLIEGETDDAHLVLVTNGNAALAQLTAREFLKSGRTIETHWAPVEQMHVLLLPSTTESAETPQ